MRCLDTLSQSRDEKSVHLIDKCRIERDSRTTSKDTSRMLGFFFANPGESVISSGILARIQGSDQRLSIGGEGLVHDILSTLGHFDAMVPSIWLQSPTLHVTSSTFGHDRRM